MTDDQLADSTYSEAVAASLLGVQILRSFPGVGDFEGTVVGTSAPAEASDPFLRMRFAGVMATKKNWQWVKSCGARRDF
jgi:hypothetical protein